MPETPEQLHAFLRDVPAALSASVARVRAIRAAPETTGATFPRLCRRPWLFV